MASALKGKRQSKATEFFELEAFGIYEMVQTSSNLVLKKKKEQSVLLYLLPCQAHSLNIGEKEREGWGELEISSNGFHRIKQTSSDWIESPALFYYTYTQSHTLNLVYIIPRQVA